MGRTVSQAGHMKTHTDALKTARREWLTPMDGNHQGDIVSVARHADASDETVLLFMNLSTNGERANTFRLDPVTQGRIDPEAKYQVTDLMDGSWGKTKLWSKARKGKDLIEQGVFADLAPYQIQALRLQKVR